MLTEFIRYLSAERRYSPLTVRNYKHDVEQFLAWLDCDESRFDPRSVTTEQIREWIIFRTEEGKLSAGSMNREVASLRAFFRWLHRTGAVEKDIFRMISTLKTSRRLPAFVPESRMTTIVSECGPDSEDFQTERNSLIILMFYACGLRLAELVGIDRPNARMKLYPHNFSGGMRQRAVLAIALASRAKILLADEPTTALDVTIQAQILDLLRRLQQKLHTATILVSHDLGVVARAADRVAVMYAGKIVEIGTAEEVYYDPRHPYTWALLRALPALSEAGGALYTIPGMPPTLIDPPPGDAFACRNEFALAIDYEKEPPMFRVSGTHYAATWLLDPRAPKITPPIGGVRHG